jgi:hypothetical protein
MDFIGTATSLAEKAGEAYGDYQRGKQVRMGTYGGAEAATKMGHYSNKKCKCMGHYTK